MKYLYPIMIIIVLASCTTSAVSTGTELIDQTGTELIDQTGTELKTGTEPSAAAAIIKPEPPIYIMGEGQIGADIMARFLVQGNPRLETPFALQFARLYIEEASFEGVNHDIAFIQMCHETGFLAFGNLVTADQNNFAGLGATGLPTADGTLDKGLYFPDLRTGVRAHIQHLKAYASTEDLNNPLVNPRRRFVRLGSSPTIDGLAGTWAADRQYAVKLKAMLQKLYDIAI